MHRFLRAVGFSMYQRRKEIESLIHDLTEQAENIKKLRVEKDAELFRIRAEVAPDMGLAICGVVEEDGSLKSQTGFSVLSP